MADTRKDHRQLLDLAEEILREYQALSLQLRQLPELLPLQEYQFYEAKLDELQASFNRFTSNFRAAGFPEDLELRETREQLSQCFNQFYLLRTGFYNQYAVRSQELVTAQELVYTLSDEELEEEPRAEAEPLIEEDGQHPLQEEAQQTKRRVRRPRLPGQQIRQQAQREAAAMLGMPFLPDQPVTEADLIRYQQRLEEQQQHMAETSAENLHREKEWLANYQEQMKLAISFERLDSHHIDMSREGARLSADPAPNIPGQSPPPEQSRVKRTDPSSAAGWTAAAGTSGIGPEISQEKAYRQWQEQQARGSLPPFEPVLPQPSHPRVFPKSKIPESTPSGILATRQDSRPDTPGIEPNTVRRNEYRKWQAQQIRGCLPPVEPVLPSSVPKASGVHVTGSTTQAPSGSPLKGNTVNRSSLHPSVPNLSHRVLSSPTGAAGGSSTQGSAAEHSAAREKTYRQWQIQRQLSAPPINTSGDIPAAKTVRNWPPPARFQLSKISIRAGDVSCVVFTAAARRAAQKTDNDAVNGIMTGSYYLSTAAGATHAVLAKPASPLIRSAKAITGTELVHINREAAHKYQDLKHQISSVQRQLSTLPATGKNTPQQRQQLQAQLSELQKQLPAAKRDLAKATQVQRFLHERELDRKLAQQLTVKNRIPRDENHLRELSQRILRDAKRDMTKKFGDLASFPEKEIHNRIGTLTEEAGRLKLQLRKLEQKGSLLTSGERSLLMKLKARNKAIGKEIGRLSGLSRARKDYAYKEARLNALVAAAGRRRQRLANGTRLVRHLALRPLHEGHSSNTEGLAYALGAAADPTVQKAVKAVASTPVKAAGWTAKKVTPKAYDAAAQAGRAAAEKLHNAVGAPARLAKRASGRAANAVSNAVPSGVKTAIKKAGAPIRYLHRKYDTVLKGVRSAKMWFSKTQIGKGLVRLQILGKNIGSLLKAIGTVSKSALLWIIGVIIGLILLISVAGSVVHILSLMMTTILSTAEPKPTGKINLEPYSKIIQTEMTRFTQQIEQLSDKYEDDPDYDKVTVTYRTKVNNTREMLSMMAVRMKQELDLGSNTEIYDYLKYLFDVSHTLTITKHEYTCSGCEYVEQQVDSVWDPTLMESVPVYDWVLICPGHTDVDFVVDVTFFDALFTADTYTTRRSDWEGWTDENIEWCKMIYNMDWTDLYDGVIVPGSTTPPMTINSEYEEQVWNYLQRLTNNPYATAGIMGNLYGLSKLNPMDLEDLYEDVLGHDDSTYTAAVDNGSYSQFQDDNAGYGLALWSDPTQKAELYAESQSYGRSIGDLTLQLAYLKRELSQGELLTSLQAAATVREASDLYLDYLSDGFPPGETTQATRAEYGSYFYNKFVLGVSAEGNLTEKQIAVIRVATDSGSYGIAATGGYCQRWAAQVYAVAGFALDSSCCAYHSGLAHGVSGDWDAIPAGAAVYGYSGTKYGHVGIYVGNGLVYHNVGGVAVDTLEDWIRKYDGFVWGWEAGTDLTIPD